MISSGTWQTVIDRPGQFGRKRDRLYAEYDEAYGKGLWRVAWEIPLSHTILYLDMPGAMALYEDAYHAFFYSQPDTLAALICEAENVYDDAPSNIHSGFDYASQETCLNHLQDISIRRAVLRLGTWFKGDKLIQVRHSKGAHPLSLGLSPGKVPFHRTDLIRQPEMTGWWIPGSIESFYQSNKVVQQLVTE
jgi:hypothetical protein